MEKANYRVWYAKNPTFFTNDKLTKADVAESHVAVCELFASCMEAVFSYMQGEIWSPNGEAGPLILRLGLHHTSMSVGDVVENIEANQFYEVVMIGFRMLPE